MKKQAPRKVEAIAEPVVVDIKEDLIIAAYEYASDDLMSMDFSWLNLKVYKVNSDEFRTYYLGILSKFGLAHYSDLFERQIHPNRYSHNYHPTLCVFVPIKIDSLVEEETFIMIEHILQIMFPSDFQIRNMVYFDKDEKNGGYSASHWSTWDKPTTFAVFRTSRNELLLKFDVKTDINEVNVFFRMAYHRSKELTWLRVAFYSYFNCFKQEDNQMRYISLCIALESICEADTEITYQLSRMCALLNCDSLASGIVIFKNLKTLYSVRSKIVHGVGIVDTETYYPYLLALTSRTLIELLTLNITSQKDLGRFATAYGFEDKPKILPGYKQVAILPSQIEILKSVLPKYKHPKDS